MLKVFISPERRPKPHGKYWGMEVYEHDVCCEIATMVEALLTERGFEVMIAPPGWTMEQRAAYANTSRFDYYLCIHTNAAGNGTKEGTATGAECLYFYAAKSIKANKLVYEQLTALYPSKRGCKDYSDFAENRLTRMVSCYPELAFHDNGKDARWIVSNKADIAAALCKGVCKYFGVEYQNKPQEPIPDDKERIAKLETELSNEHAARQAEARRADRAEGKLQAVAELIARI